jgi:hypothetical protein
MSKTQFNPHEQFRVALDEELDEHYLKYNGPEPENEEEAWDISLGKWEFLSRIAARGEVPCEDDGPNTCGLCMLYYGEEDDVFARRNCIGCPVHSFTGMADCLNTPYAGHKLAVHVSTAGEMHRTAMTELNFLKLVRFWKEHGGQDD